MRIALFDVVEAFMSRAGVEAVFFLIRTVFWLSIVFSSMSWAVGASPPRSFRDVVVESGAAMAGAAKDAALTRAKAWCVKSPDQCLTDAARLTALVAANQSEDLTEAVGNVSAPPLQAIPVPHPAPRRHGLPEKLTPAR